ncbi:hypothetical protein HYY75_07800, partial [bacterium]|nr:hypothetical protein [bacterium]
NIINSANLNIDASVNESGQLVMASSLTGTKNAISFQNGTSNIATVLNLKTNQQAQDAVFSIDGNQYTTQENTVRGVLNGATLFINGNGVANLDLHPAITNGKIAGLLAVRDGNVQSVRDKPTNRIRIRRKTCPLRISSLPILKPLPQPKEP